MTPAESLAQMEEHKAWFINLARTHSQTLRAPLDHEEWSIIEILDHLIQLERGIALTLARAKDPLPPRTPADTEQLNHYVRILTSAEKYPVPDAAGTPNPDADLETLLADWEKARSRIADRIQQNNLPQPSVAALIHPVAGPLNAEETLQFVALHLHYHRTRTTQLLSQNK